MVIPHGRQPVAVSGLEAKREGRNGVKTQKKVLQGILRCKRVGVRGIVFALIFWLPSVWVNKAWAYSLRNEGFLLERNLPVGKRLTQLGKEVWIGGGPKRPYVLLAHLWEIQGVGCDREESFEKALRRAVKESRELGGDGIIVWEETPGLVEATFSWVPERIMVAYAFRYRTDSYGFCRAAGQHGQH